MVLFFVVWELVTILVPDNVHFKYDDFLTILRQERVSPMFRLFHDKGNKENRSQTRMRFL